jgi:hypothetical protein
MFSLIKLYYNAFELSNVDLLNYEPSDRYGRILLKNSNFSWVGNLFSMSRVLKFGIRGERAQNKRSLSKKQMVSLHSQC